MDKKELTQEEILEKELNNNKEVEYYSHLVNGWITTRMEKDKALLALSTAGIGVLITFFNNISIENNLSFFLYLLALLFFIISIISGIWILSENAKYCEFVIKEEELKNEALIIRLDFSLIISFILGLIVSIALSVTLINKKTNEYSINSIKKIERTINSLKAQYTNDLTSLEKMSKDIIELKNYKEKLKKEVNILSKELKKLEDMKKFKEEKSQIKTRINEFNKVVE